ncbi:MAG: acetyl-CoA C-acyltransferase [Pseudomonadota bacterium]
MRRMTEKAYIVAAARTPIGRAHKGAFANTRPDDLLAHVLRGVVDQVPSMDPAAIEDVIIGCAMPEAEQGMNVARIATLLAGLPDSVPAMTVNRFCSSGLQTIATAAEQIQLGQADVMIAGGTESMTMVPMMGHKVSFNPSILANDENVAIAYGMGITAEKVAKKWEVSREAQDAFALRSHQRAIAAIEAGKQQLGSLPYEVTRYLPGDDGSVREVRHTIEVDEGPRPDTSLEVLGKLRPVFAARGSVTAGNSSQMSDGAAALVLMSERAVKEHNVEPLAVFHGFSVAGVPPQIMGIGPIAAIPKALKRTGVKLDDLSWVELNEAFAAQALAVIKEVGLDDEKTNPLGGAIALGHPLGATGAVLATKLVHNLKASKPAGQSAYGMVTMCIGTGMGAAGVLEVL